MKVVRERDATFVPRKFVAGRGRLLHFLCPARVLAIAGCVTWIPKYATYQKILANYHSGRVQTGGEKKKNTTQPLNDTRNLKIEQKGLEKIDDFAVRRFLPNWENNYQNTWTTHTQKKKQKARPPSLYQQLSHRMTRQSPWRSYHQIPDQLYWQWWHDPSPPQLPLSDHNELSS